MHRCSEWFVQLEKLLSSSKQICLSCGAGYDRSKPLPVCSDCWAAIPWIGEVMCSRCGRYEVCTDCIRRENTYYTQNRSAVRYDDNMKEWLALHKYRGKERLRQVLGPMLLHAYHLHRHNPVDSTEREATVQWISFVPLSEERLQERGFNQARQLAEELGKLTGLPVISLLRRTRHTDKQSFKARAARLDDLKDVFEVDGDGLAYMNAMAVKLGKHRVYLIDDVYTTGSTLNECARTLRQKLDVEVYGISWAR
ncbi:hypothetical protein PAECIP111802_06116 [Paenibacillus allorhizosphaerae]|uniref:ComF family protein n=2 Tax=Paenibacillus allorhizosphaerae TaxID=2849866 RepID=A0ABM8VRP5_9BACL|nr:hypothetical protein PAECIP111802_06116 [Paenibacillus allorhizosphaerae]